MVNQAFRIKIAFWSKKKKKKEKEKEKKIPGIGRYLMGPTKRQELDSSIRQNFGQSQDKMK